MWFRPLQLRPNPASEAPTTVNAVVLDDDRRPDPERALGRELASDGMDGQDDATRRQRRRVVEHPVDRECEPGRMIITETGYRRLKISGRVWAAIRIRLSVSGSRLNTSAPSPMSTRLQKGQAENTECDQGVDDDRRESGSSLHAGSVPPSQPSPNPPQGRCPVSSARMMNWRVRRARADRACTPRAPCRSSFP